MSKRITVNIAAQAAQGAPLSENVVCGDLAEVCDYAVDVPAVSGSTAGTEVINVQPGSGPAHVCFLLISAPGSYAPTLTYTFAAASATAAATSLALDSMHMFSGSGAIGLLQNLSSITFTNNGAQPASVRVLVGLK